MNILAIAAAGFLGTTLMIGVMALIHRFKLANADMVRAVGSFYTKSYELSLVPGLLIQYSFGVFFAFMYAMIIGFSPVITPGSSVIISTLVGLVHGLVVGLFLVVMIAEFHPIEQFRNAGMGVALAHVVGHIAYGLCVGTVFATNWRILEDSFTSMDPGKIIGDILGFAFIWFPLFGIPLLFGAYVLYVNLTDRIRVEAKSKEKGKRATSKKRRGSGNSRLTRLAS